MRFAPSALKKPMDEYKWISDRWVGDLFLCGNAKNSDRRSSNWNHLPMRAFAHKTVAIANNRKRKSKGLFEFGGDFMRATGIVRRIDELGRVVIPKEIRRTLRIREGDPLEIFTDHDGEVVLKKYSPIGEISAIAKDYTDSLYRTLGHIALICDRDAMVSSSGAAKREYVEKALSTEVDHILQNRQLTVLNLADGERMIPLTNDDRPESYTAEIIAPILADGEIIGGLILVSREAGAAMSDVDRKVAETTANIVGKQMEQ